MVTDEGCEKDPGGVLERVIGRGPFYSMTIWQIPILWHSVGWLVCMIFIHETVKKTVLTLLFCWAVVVTALTFNELANGKFTETYDYCHIDVIHNGRGIHVDKTGVVEKTIDKKTGIETADVIISGDTLKIDLVEKIDSGYVARIVETRELVLARFTEDYVVILNPKTKLFMYFVDSKYCEEKPDTVSRWTRFDTNEHK